MKKCGQVLKTDSKEPDWAVNIRTTYVDETNFLKTFNPSIQSKCIQNIERSFVGTAPSLNRLKIAFNYQVTETWLMIQIADLSEYCNIEKKPSEQSIENLANTIITNYGYLKVTELMVFFQKFKSGEYGRFYGVIDNLIITESLVKFLEFRRLQIDIIERRIERERREEESTKKGVTYEEYLKMKEEKKQS